MNWKFWSKKEDKKEKVTKETITKESDPKPKK
ncbi:hypothetical protein HER12_000251 [Spiroplasma platyhelix PALS-1]|nr:hypothetical protein [Spiroplasma platyhelix PALS-1]UJB29272.1 hypothetical protein SPLAT_v1c05080 [Spiroplasma platyhelix PALS-1]